VRYAIDKGTSLPRSLMPGVSTRIAIVPPHYKRLLLEHLHDLGQAPFQPSSFLLAIYRWLPAGLRHAGLTVPGRAANSESATTNSSLLGVRRYSSTIQLRERVLALGGHMPLWPQPQTGALNVQAGKTPVLVQCS